MLKQIALIVSIVFLELAPYGKCDCDIELREPLPIGKMKIGSKGLLLNREKRNLTLNKDESITFYCPSKIRYGYANFAESRVTFHCSNVNGQSNLLNDINQNIVKFLQCDELVVFESNQTLPSCHHYISYAIGHDLENINDAISMAMCYDLFRLNVKYVTYMSSEVNPYHILDKDYLGALLNLSPDLRAPVLSEYSSFINESQFETDYANKQQTYRWLSNLEFTYEPLILNSIILHNFNDLRAMLNVMWWKNLRSGNWKIVNDLLEKRTKDNRYILYVGTNGTLDLPAAPKGTISVESDSNKVEAFEYVWTYLKSLNSSVKEDLVLIGYNSPHIKADLIFCKDICDEVDWLQENKVFARTRMMPLIGGLVFCCTPQDVAAKFENFPWNDKTQDLYRPTQPKLKTNATIH